MADDPKKTTVPQQTPANPNPKAHVGFPYPAEFPVDLIGYVIDYVRGQEVEFSCFVNATWAGVGFGLSKAFPHEVMMARVTKANIKALAVKVASATAMTDDELVAALESLKGNSTAKGFDWRSLIKTLLAFLLPLLA